MGRYSEDRYERYESRKKDDTVKVWCRGCKQASRIEMNPKESIVDAKCPLCKQDKLEYYIGA